MKKFPPFILTVVGLAVASCSLNPIDETFALKGKKTPVTINARQADDGETKSVRNADKSVSWMPSDEILVICGDDRAKFTSTNTENSPTVAFRGELDEATVDAVSHGTSTYCVWGLYPYDENAESDGTYVTTTLPNVQTGVAGTFEDDLFITLAKSDDFNLYFYNVCSGFKFSVTKAGVTSIKIQGKDNEYLAGKVKLSFGSDGKPKVDEVLDGQKVITLTPEKSTFEVGKDYYFVTLPTDFSDGFIVTLNTPSETGVFDVSTSLSFPRSKFVAKNDVDAVVVYGAKEGNIYIPDANFKAYCVEVFDTDHDEEISYSEALGILAIDVCTDAIETVQGIEFMSNLGTLYIWGTNGWANGMDTSNGILSSIDVSNNTALTRLNCYYNQLTSLDVSNNTILTYLCCGVNQLASLDVSNNTALTELYCGSNQLTSLDVSNNTALAELDCGSNQLTSLDVSNNTALTKLFCDSNQLTSLDVNNNTALIYLDCASNQLTALDVSHNTALAELMCNHNQLTSLIFGYNSALYYLMCNNNQLTTLDVSNNTALTNLSCNYCLLASLDISNNTELMRLICQGNSLATLDVSNNSALTSLNCKYSPYLTEIWLKTGQTITDFQYDTSVATIKYKD